MFRLFDAEYIQKRINIFSVIDAVSLVDFTGKSYARVREKLESGELKDIDAAIGSLRSRVKSFSVYRLGNSLIQSGVGCGFYDPVGKGDKNGIRVLMNDYLFDFCFDGNASPNNYEHFVDYLLMSFANTFGSDIRQRFIPSVAEFTKVLSPERLAKYWSVNRDAIKAKNFTAFDKVVYTANFAASYRTDLAQAFQVLDDYIDKLVPASQLQPTVNP